MKSFPPTSTSEFSPALCDWTSTESLRPGPRWSSYEEFRKQGTTNLASITPRTVGTLQTKGGTFRIIREADFQWLLGIATDVSRVQKGIRVAANAARIAIQFPDKEHIQLFAEVASTMIQSPLLPQREGHHSFELTDEEIEQESGDDFNAATATIPRPKW